MRIFLLGLFAVILINAGLMLHYHNRYLCAADDGVFAHVAERILNGEVLHKDIAEVHSGYVNFINALAFKIFGVDFVSLRYPLFLVTVAQSILVFVLFYARGAAVAVVASIVPTVLGVLQFLNPNPHWYALCLTIFITLWLTFVPPVSRHRLIVTGFLLMTLYLVRQPTAIFVAMGVLCLLLLEPQDGKAQRKPFWAKAIAAVLILGLLFYLFSAADLGGFLLMGMWPFILLGRVYFLSRMPDVNVWVLVRELSLGALAGLFPILIYHMSHGSLSYWFNDTFINAILAARQPYIKQFTFTMLINDSMYLVTHAHAAGNVINGIYWVLLTLSPSILGVMVLRKFHAGGNARQWALPLIAVFYGIVALHNQIPHYLHFAVALPVLGIIWVGAHCFRPMLLVPILVTVLAVCMVAVYYHSDQRPISWRGVIQGDRRASVYAGGTLARTHLWVDDKLLAQYQSLMEVVQKETGAEDAIFAVPNQADIYFMARRRNIFKFSSTDVGIRNEEDLKAVIEQIHRDKPRLVIYAKDDKRNNRFSWQIMDVVRTNYELMNVIGMFEVYRLRP